MGHPLPELLNEIASVIGHDAMLALVAAYGGTRIFVPAQLTDDHWLVELLGAANADKLCSHFTIHGSNRSHGRGNRLDIPAFNRSIYNNTAARIEQFDNGKTSAREVALKAGVAERTVTRHRQLRRKKMKGRK